ncbi:hypothetical protein HPB52_020090 [Rhipicephalus sanguineus]|uniref:Uncharacterized protein n=1 Tax=Rhipicephalus sanguineus TaxID=34632 RepID=A0A9D4PE91_RHISA|nr:hypothetical protein HPB52_020090 [Rhipicephalus sanguineus]
MLWLCPANASTDFLDQSSSDSALRSTELIAQLKVVQRARAIAEGLGGLRSVVWADCVQAFIMTAAPFTIIGKILYDSSHATTPPRPLADLNYATYILRLM